MDHDELEHIAKLLRQCLHRIERDAKPVQDGRVDADPEAVMNALQGDTEQLRELLNALLGHLQGPLDLNDAVQDAIDGLLRRLEVPLVVNKRLEEGLPGVRWPRGALYSGMRRAVQLAARHAGSGGVLDVVTRAHGDHVLFEMTASGSGEPEVLERYETLQDFVDQMEDRCDLQDDGRGGLHLRIEFRSRARVEEV